MQMSSSEFVSPDALLDLGFCSPRLDASSWLGAPVSWEMSLGDEHRNLPLQLGPFSWLSFVTTGLQPPANHPLNGAHTFAIFCKKKKKTPFTPNFISQLLGHWNILNPTYEKFSFLKYFLSCAGRPFFHRPWRYEAALPPLGLQAHLRANHWEDKDQRQAGFDHLGFKLFFLFICSSCCGPLLNYESIFSKITTSAFCQALHYKIIWTEPFSFITFNSK